MNITEQSIIGELVAQDYRTASVFRQNGIDFCCNGNRTLGEACEQGKLNTQELLEKLRQEVSEGQQTATDFQSWSPDLLADYIEKKHHRYVAQKVQEIKPYLEKIVRVHGEKHPELAEIQHLFVQSAEELASHMTKEENVLFPFIRKMTESRIAGQPLEKPPFGTVQNPIAMMHREHDTEGERFRKIAELSNNYTPPPDACNTYRVTFALLKEFEEDLHLHIHLENNILFPKSVKMEREIQS